MIAAAMATRENSSPTYADLARAGAVLQRIVPAQTWPRLSKLVNDLGPVELHIEFAFDDQHRLAARGHARMQCSPSCQWCSEPVRRDLTAAFSYWIVRSETEARRLSEDWAPGDPEIVLIERDVFDPVDLLEDELILHLPTRVCIDAQCERRPRASYGDAAQAEPENPFGVLADWKNSLGERDGSTEK